MDVVVPQKKNAYILSCPKLQLHIRFSDILLQGKVAVSFEGTILTMDFLRFLTK